MKEERLERGNKLWEGSRMFLPQHKQALLNRRKEQQKVTKPELDEQELEELNRTLRIALTTKEPVRITYYHDGAFLEFIGCVDQFFENRMELRVIDPFHRVHRLKTCNVVNLEREITPN